MKKTNEKNSHCIAENTLEPRVSLEHWFRSSVNIDRNQAFVMGLFSRKNKKNAAAAPEAEPAATATPAAEAAAAPAATAQGGDMFR